MRYLPQSNADLQQRNDHVTANSGILPTRPTATGLAVCRGWLWSVQKNTHIFNLKPRSINKTAAAETKRARGKFGELDEIALVSVRVFSKLFHRGDGAAYARKTAIPYRLLFIVPQTPLSRAEQLPELIENQLPKRRT